MKEIKILKRDGREAVFNKEKIKQAIIKAFTATTKEERPEYIEQKAENIATYIANYVEGQESMLTVEDIQDLVEKGLMSTKCKDVAKAYILYRDQRTAERERQSDLIKTIEKKIKASDVQNQNANVDEYSFGGRMGEANSALMRKFALDYCLSDMAKRNHLENQIYIHDLDHYAVGTHNCLSVPFDDLLAKGFNTRQTDVRPANSINTAFQLVAVIFQLQSLQQFGGVSATHLDWTMVPYVRKSFRKHWNDGLRYVAFWPVDEEQLETEDRPIDEYMSEDDYRGIYRYAMDMTLKETQQAVEGMFHNLNTLQSRSGNQLN